MEISSEVDELKRTKVSPPREVEGPTYEIMDRVERYDQRDHPTARSIMKSNTPEYEDYYRIHPELKEWDDQNRLLRAKAIERQEAVDPINMQFKPSVFYTRTVLGQVEVCEGNLKNPHLPSTQKSRIEVDEEEITEKIKAYARYLGADKVRVTRLNPNWIYTHYAHPYSPEPYGKAVELNYKYIICMAVRQDPLMIANGSGIAQGMEVGWKYTYGSLLSVIIAEFIRRLGWPARAMPPENSPYIMPPVFVDAGMGEQGRCSFVVTKEFGNNFRPGAVATDLPLKVDRPVDFGLQDFCEKCLICAETCPSGAISKGGKEVIRGVKRWHMDGEKCRRYWDLRGQSCAICQAVCPWNHPNNWFHNTVREMGGRLVFSRGLLIAAHELFYGKFKPALLPSWMETKGIKKEIKR